MTEEEKKEYLMHYWQSYSEQANEITSKRQTLNSIYLSLEIALLGFAITYLKLTGLFLSIAGLIINIIWMLTIFSYKKLNSVKFEIVHDLEDIIGLDIKPYNMEWKKLKSKRYINLTIFELVLVVVLIILFLIGIVLSILSF
jgi:hypothetical protein